MSALTEVLAAIPTMPPEDLDRLKEAVQVEVGRREVLASSEEVIADLTTRYRAAAGITDGTEFRQPTGAHDVVPAEETRVFEGDLWRNTAGRPLAHSPGEYPEGWERVVTGASPTPGPDPAAHPEWSEGSYVRDDTRTFEGEVYRCLRPHTSEPGQNPPVATGLWALVGGALPPKPPPAKQG